MEITLGEESDGTPIAFVFVCILLFFKSKVYLFQHNIFCMNFKNKYLSPILENILPLCGVMFFGWSAFSLLLAYWLETLVIGFFTILKMKRATKNLPINEQNKLIPGTLRSVTSLETKFAIGFFMVHYGMFCVGHFIFLKIFATLAHDPISFSWFVLLSAIPFFVAHEKKFQEEFLANKEYEKIPLAMILFSPYKRIALLHVVLLLGGIPFILLQNLPSQCAVLLIVLKVVLDMKFGEKTKQIISQINEKSQ